MKKRKFSKKIVKISSAARSRILKFFSWIFLFFSHFFKGMNKEKYHYWREIISSLNFLMDKANPEGKDVFTKYLSAATATCVVPRNLSLWNSSSRLFIWEKIRENIDFFLRFWKYKFSVKIYWKKAQCLRNELSLWMRT